MTSRKVRPGQRFVYDPVMMDAIDPSYGVKAGLLKAGDVVKVMKSPRGCPPCGTMGHCYVESLAGKFLGLFVTNSLQPIGGTI